MTQLMYQTLVPWYRLIDPTADHADECASYRAALELGATPPLHSLLELGSGAGNNAFHLKNRFRCTLCDLSERMLELSRDLNPECEHVSGDMRYLRLGRTFDAVLVHDAIMYMTTESDLESVIETAFMHTRPGGASVFAPDFVRETFRECTNLIEEEDGVRALRGIEWSWDPDPSDTTFRTEYVFLLRDSHSVRSYHDRHVEGLFSREDWLGLLCSAGFEPGLVDRPIDDGGTDQVFLCRRPA